MLKTLCCVTQAGNKESVLCGSTYMTYLEQWNPRAREYSGAFQVNGRGHGGVFGAFRFKALKICHKVI
jgi:hypothetical protein